jgi:hypothetical protein
VAEARCSEFRAQLREQRHWLAILPGDYLCKRIGREAAHFAETNYVASPAWAEDGKPLPADHDPLADLI